MPFRDGTHLVAKQVQRTAEPTAEWPSPPGELFAVTGQAACVVRFEWVHAE